MKLSSHINLTIEHQPHALNYQTVEEWLADFGHHPMEADRAAMVATGEVWCIQWYPRTPVGFLSVCAATLERALELMQSEDPDGERVAGTSCPNCNGTT